MGELLTVFPEVLRQVAHSRLLLVGFGTYREHLEGMVQALRAGKAKQFARYARAGGFVQELDFARWFRRLSKEEASRIALTGMLDHDVLRDVLPLVSLTVVPSKWPEAFGMVAVESMAAGVLPLCTYHAGLRDVVDAVAAEDAELAEWMSLPRDRFVDELPGRICAALEFLYPEGFGDPTQRNRVGRRLRKIAISNFSWEEIVKRLLRPKRARSKAPGKRTRRARARRRS
ncbi:MAG: glycosyltransferase [Planctomycetota bacterium]